MKKFNLISLFTIALLVLVSISAVKAQNEVSPDASQRQTDKPRRQDILRELGLTPDQRQQMKQINTESKPRMMEAQQRLREANRNLDQAIYADIIDEVQVRARLKDVQLAQAEVFKIRALTELSVRRILTPDQLVKFREIRQRFIEKKENREARPPDAPPPGNNPRSNSLRPKS